MATDLNSYKWAILQDERILALFCDEELAITASEAIPDSEVITDFYTDMSSTYYVEFSK